MASEACGHLVPASESLVLVVQFGQGLKRLLLAEHTSEKCKQEDHAKGADVWAGRTEVKAVVGVGAVVRVWEDV